MTIRSEDGSARPARPPGGTALALAVYGLIWVLVVVLYANRALHHAFTDDFWEHVANIRRLAADPLGGVHPLLAVNAPSPLESPYAWVLGMIARVTGVPSATVFVLAGFGVAAALAVSLLAFVRALGGSRWVALSLPALALVFWGPTPGQWSGFLNLTSISLVLAYPSTIALAVALGALALALRPAAGWGTCLAIVAASWFVALV